MTYFPDLSHYEYGGLSQPGVLNVGWLDDTHPFTQGTVDAYLIQRLKLLAAKPVEIYRGSHICDLCAEPALPKETLAPHHLVLDLNSPYGNWLAPRISNGEIRVSSAGVTFAAPRADCPLH
jgi:hypothetical protein